LFFGRTFLLFAFACCGVRRVGKSTHYGKQYDNKKTEFSHEIILAMLLLNNLQFIYFLTKITKSAVMKEDISLHCYHKNLNLRNLTKILNKNDINQRKHPKSYKTFGAHSKKVFV